MANTVSRCSLRGGQNYLCTSLSTLPTEIFGGAKLRGTLNTILSVYVSVIYVVSSALMHCRCAIFREGIGPLAGGAKLFAGKGGYLPLQEVNFKLEN